MTSTVEIGQAVRQLRINDASMLTRSGTKLLESCGDLSRTQLASLSQAVGGDLVNELPEVQRLLGIPEGDFGHTVFFGRPYSENIIGPGGVRPRRHFTIYERHRNITLFSAGDGFYLTPTPSGQKLLMQRINFKGDYADVNTRPRYMDSCDDCYGTISSATAGISNWVNVVTHPDSRQVSIGGDWIHDNHNFAPLPSLVDMAKAGRPGKVVDMDVVNKLLGIRVANPHATGWLIGFDPIAGEALVSYDDWCSPGFDHWSCGRKVVKDLEGLYPVELKPWEGGNLRAYRNAVGQVFDIDPHHNGYKLCPTSRVMAFAPIEVGSNGVGNLAQLLGLDWNVGLRALGGFWTDRGGKIPLAV